MSATEQVGADGPDDPVAQFGPVGPVDLRAAAGEATAGGLPPIVIEGGR